MLSIKTSLTFSLGYIILRNKQSKLLKNGLKMKQTINLTLGIKENKLKRSKRKMLKRFRKTKFRKKPYTDNPQTNLRLDFQKEYIINSARVSIKNYTTYIKQSQVNVIKYKKEFKSNQLKLFLFFSPSLPHRKTHMSVRRETPSNIKIR